MSYKNEWFDWFRGIGINSCSICSSTRDVELNHFHHRNEVDKKFNISEYYMKPCTTENKLLLLPELNKCDMICPDCHGKLHYNEGIKTLRGRRSDPNNKTQLISGRLPMSTVQQLRLYSSNTNNTRTKSIIDLINRGFINWVATQEG